MTTGLAAVEDSGNCPVCNAHVDTVKVSAERQNLMYGAEGKSVSVIVPVHTCGVCKFRWMGPDAEAVRDFAVREAGGLLG